MAVLPVTDRDTVYKSIRFERPDYIPMSFHINGACWHRYEPKALIDLMADHPLLFPDFKATDSPKSDHYGLNHQKGRDYTDAWKCVWRTSENGITGTVVKHPLESYDQLDSFHMPDPTQTDGIGPVDWESIRTRANNTRDQGGLLQVGLTHGHTFLRLLYIRGYENMLFDMADNNPGLSSLIEMVEAFNRQFIAQWIDLAPDIMGFPEDLGMQSGPMLSPGQFRAFIKPVYQRLMEPVRERGIAVHMHSDGDIRSLIDDIIAGGVEVINLQDLVNGIDWIKKKLAGRICIDLDIDRQQITPYGTPRQIDELIRTEVSQLGSREGGLMMVYGLYPGVPLENVRAVMDAMVRYASFYR